MFCKRVNTSRIAALLIMIGVASSLSACITDSASSGGKIHAEESVIANNNTPTLADIARDAPGLAYVDNIPHSNSGVVSDISIGNLAPVDHLTPGTGDCITPPPGAVSETGIRIIEQSQQIADNLRQNLGRSCAGAAINTLKQVDAQGFTVLANLPKPSEASRFLNCNRSDYDLGTLVHESSHMVTQSHFTGREFSMLLPDGKLHTVPYDEHFFKLTELQVDLPQRDIDHYAETYIFGGGQQQSFPWMLDELNAYTHELITMTHLSQAGIKSVTSSYRDGPTRFMHYVELYLRRARVAHPEQWEKIASEPKYLDLIQNLWHHAESAISESCPHDELGIASEGIFPEVYTPDNLNELHELFAKAGKKFVTQQGMTCKVPKQIT